MPKYQMHNTAQQSTAQHSTAGLLNSTSYIFKKGKKEDNYDIGDKIKNNGENRDDVRGNSTAILVISLINCTTGRYRITL